MKIGIDVGGVIIDKANDGEDTSLFGPDYLQARPVVGAIEAIAKINREIFPSSVYIVSKCGEKIEGRTREWLKAHAFQDKTGVTEERLHFCRERSDKAPIARRLGLTHFVDDRMEVLGYMRGIVVNRIFFNPSGRVIRRDDLFSGPVILVFSWKDVLDWLTSRPKDASAGSTIETLKNFFIARQEFEYAKAVVALGSAYVSGTPCADDAFMLAESAKNELLEQQRVDMASMLTDILKLAKDSVEEIGS